MGKSKSVFSRVELGQVRVSPDDATIVQQGRIRLTRWLTEEPADSDNRNRPARLGAMLSTGQFVNWSVR